MPRRFAYGRKRPVMTAARRQSMFAFAAALEELPTPPKHSSDYMSKVTVPWGMYGNDQVGNCTCADTAHALMLRTANAGAVTVPAQSDVDHLYEQFGWRPNNPSTDNGVLLDDLVAYLRTAGFMGHKPDAIGAIPHQNINALKWGIQLLGSVRIGLNLPGYAEDQFARGEPWDISSDGDADTEGHDVLGVYYNSGNLWGCVSWGRVQWMTSRFLFRYIDEAFGELWLDWIRANGTAPSGFKIDELAGKLNELEQNAG